MTTVILDGGSHGHEHFQFDGCPRRIRVQTKESGGVYGRQQNRVSVYQDTKKVSGGCRVFAFVRTTNGIANNRLVEAEYD